jgi:hypothetical protein
VIIRNLLVFIDLKGIEPMFYGTLPQSIDSIKLLTEYLHEKGV